MLSQTIALICATPTQKVSAETCLMFADTPGLVLGLRLITPTQTRKTILFHLWDDTKAQMLDPRLKADVITFLKHLGGANIWHNNAQHALTTLNHLLAAVGKKAIDNPRTCLTTLLDDGMTLDTLATHMGQTSDDISAMHARSLIQLHVLDHLWTHYFQMKDANHTLMPNLPKKEALLLSNTHAHLLDQTLLSPAEKILALLHARGFSKSVLTRLELSRATDGL